MAVLEEVVVFHERGFHEESSLITTPESLRTFNKTQCDCFGRLGPRIWNSLTQSLPLRDVESLSTRGGAAFVFQDQKHDRFRSL